MSLIWYVFANDIVSGPFSTENIEKGLTQKQWPVESLIWWKGQREWISLQAWRLDLKNILDGFRTNIQTTPWYVEHLGTQKGPMYSRDLQSFIQSNAIVGDCRVWTEGMERWKNVYEIPELVQFFGITRRKHPRAPIKASLEVQASASEEPIVVPTGSISTGGLGVRGLTGIMRGQHISVLLKTPLLTDAVLTDAKVVYTMDSGISGLEFTNLSPESASIITEYVTQFK
jgi:hypothetical protein